MTTLCLSSTSLQAATQYWNVSSKAASKQLISYDGTSIRQPRSQAVESQGRYPQQPALLAQKPLKPMLRANRPARSLPLWLLPSLLIACTAGETIGFPHMVSNLPKRSCSAKCETQPHAAPTRHSPHGLHMRHGRPFQLQYDEHHISSMCSARWLEAYIYALISNRTQLVAPNMPSPFAKPVLRADENRLWTLTCHSQRSQNKVRHGFTRKATSIVYSES